MSFETWWTFLIGSILICASPGPNMLQVLSCSVKYGFRKSVYTMAGCLSAISLLIIISILGTGALLTASPDLFLILRYLGAAYLIYIGIRSCFNKGTKMSLKTGELSDRISGKDIFKKGFFVGISNPKAMLFAMAFFSQFIDISKPYISQFVLLFLTFVMIECSCYVIYALFGKAISRLLKKEKALRIFNFIIGLIFIGFGVFLLK
jgi:threonine/homoserine/homoserine lactone efflux protein